MLELDISFVIVNWNAKSYLLQCLQSIFDTQGILRTETIVVDNGSSDGSVDAVRNRFPWVLVIENGMNLGFAKANNIGVRASKGKYLCLINSDVIVIDKCFQILHHYMETNPSVGIVGPKMLGPDRKTRRSTMSFPCLKDSLFRAVALDSFFPKSSLFGQFLMAYKEISSVQKVDILNGFFWLIRREAIDVVGLLDEDFFIYGEDMDICKRFANLGWSRIFVPSAAAIHFGGASSARAPLRFFIEMQKANLQYWKKHHTVWETRGYWLILLAHYSIRFFGYAIQSSINLTQGEENLYKMRRSRTTINWLSTHFPSRYVREIKRK